MNINTDFMQSISADDIMESLTKPQMKRYKRYAENLLSKVHDENALKPVMCFRACKITEVSADGVKLEGIPFLNTVLSFRVSEGDTVYACIVTAGNKLDAFCANLKDSLLQYMGTLLMQRTLEEGLSTAVTEIVSAFTSRENVCIGTVIPGIDGICGMDQVRNLLALMPDEVNAAGLSVGENGLVHPLYTRVSVLYTYSAESNLPAVDANAFTKREFVREMEKEAGHR